MDDLKVYAEDDDKLKKLIKVVQQYSNDIGMTFGLDKCAKCTIRKGKKIKTQNLKLEEENMIEDLDEESAYKYLGIQENASIEHKQMREKASNEYI